MAFGDNPVDGSLRDAWHAFCDQAKAAGDAVFKDESGSSDGERTNAFRYLTQNLSQAFDIWLENRDPLQPSLLAFCGPTRKLGADNPDCTYHQSWINDHDTYRISGNRGTARMLNVALQGEWKGPLHEPFGDKPIANVLGEQLVTRWNGEFELWVGPEPHEGNWLRSEPGARKLFYRQYFDHWDEVPASFRIERISNDAAPPPAITPAELIDTFARAGQFVRDCTEDWPDTVWNRDGTYDWVNSFGRTAGGREETIDSRRGRVIDSLNWRVEPHEALVLDFEIEPRQFWQLGACSVFGASLEFRYRQTSLTSGMTPVDPDGRTRPWSSPTVTPDSPTGSTCRVTHAAGCCSATCTRELHPSCGPASFRWRT